MFSEGIDINVALVALYSGRQLAWLNVVFCSALPAAVYKVVALQSPGVQPSSDQARGWRADEDEERPLVLLDSISGTGTTIWTALTESWTASVAPSAAFRQAWGQFFWSSALRRPWQFSKASSWLKSRQSWTSYQFANITENQSLVQSFSKIWNVLNFGAKIHWLKNSVCRSMVCFAKLSYFIDSFVMFLSDWHDTARCWNNHQNM